MAEPVLLDTGVLVALASRRDRDHARCVGAIQSLRGPIVTVEGVLVEATHLLRGVHDGPAKLLELVGALRVIRHAVTEPGLTRVVELMRRYARMDFVDGLLVTTAEELRMRRILTLDRRDFSIYRLRSGRALELLP